MGSEAVREWFERAVVLPERDRRAFLNAQCADSAVRAEVLSLLEYDLEETRSAPEVALPDAMVSEAIDALFAATAPLTAPAAPAAGRVGPFELGQLLGSGGMGFVYEAHRVDGAVRQRVAVKFAQVAATASKKTRESVHRRFHRERQLLASLRHPYIAGLIDAGTTETGVPYAVIEQVDGVPIDAYCDTAQPDLAGRIGLFLKLCEAVQFAHRNLVVHSDIKPDNVLVTAGGIPKLIDFGVASDLAEEVTLTKMRAFTPGYASPEQARGEAPTVATDVYGLGALLFRMLTGQRPHNLQDLSLAEAIRRISEEEVTRPSAIRRELRGDLENILLKALQRDPARRYGSVPELADDLNRYLARRPVRASPDSMPYRARRFVRRHWLPLAATAALIAGLVGATFVSARQREFALRRAAETRRLADRLLFEVHDEISGLAGGTTAREKLGAIAVQYLEGLERDYPRDPELAWELLSAYARLSQSRAGTAASVGDTRSGVSLARKVLALGRIVEAAGPEAKRLDSLFLAYESLLLIFQEAGLPNEQRETVTRMLRLAPRLQPLREAQAYKELARYHDQEHAGQESAEAFERALAILRRLAAQGEGRPAGTDGQLISTLVGYGRTQALRADFSEAVASLREAIRLSEQSRAADPRQAKASRQLYWSHIVLGDVLGSTARFSLGRPDEAVEHYVRGRQIAEALAAADPGNEAATLDVARALSREASALGETNPARALAAAGRAYDLAVQTSPGNHTGLESRYAYLCHSVEIFVHMRDLDRAQTVAAEARRVLGELQRDGVRVSEGPLLRAETLRLQASGQTAAALSAAQRHLALLPGNTNPVLSENFEAVQALERIRRFAAGSDVEACTAATERLARIWSELRPHYPRSAFVAAQAERALAAKQRGCAQQF